MHTVTIAPYHDELKDEVIALVTSVQQEFGVPVTIADQPDLQDIPNVYQQGAGNFWVAMHEGMVIGCIALIDCGQHTGIIRKMFLHPSYRGKDKGISHALLLTLTAWATDNNIRDLFLGTVDKLPAASRFYEKNGFHLIDESALPPHVSSVRMKVDNRHYYKELAA